MRNTTLPQSVTGRSQDHACVLKRDTQFDFSLEGSMRSFFVLFFLIIAATAQSEAIMECERYYTGGDNKKENRKVFRFTLSPKESTLTYEKISGDDWLFPSTSSLQPAWISEDGLKVVAQWVASDYGSNDERRSPVYITEADFGEPSVTVSSFGGDNTINFLNQLKLWKNECRRVN